MLRILLIANFKPDQQESMNRFCDLLLRGLAAHGHDVSVLRPEPFFVRLLPRPGSLRKWLGYVDKFLLFPLMLASRVRAYDIVHVCDHSNSLYTRFLRGKPNVVTCHDLMAVRSALEDVPENPTGWSGRILQRAILRGLRRAQFVVCVSRQTQREVLRLAGRSESSTPCIYNGLNYQYSPMDKAQAFQRLETLTKDAVHPFFLHVGGNQWYKNRPGVLQIFECLRSREQFSNYRLVMVGKPFDQKMRSLIESRDLSDSVIELTSLPNEDLRALYSLAEGLLFPSLDEGFGWPIVEAQACGCPVFTSNRSPMTEVGGPAAIYFDPCNPAAACETIAGNLGRREQLPSQGLENAQRFSTHAMLQAYEEVYSLAIRNAQVRPLSGNRTKSRAG